MYYSKNSELKITLLLVNINVNTECQHGQNSAAGLYLELSLIVLSGEGADCIYIYSKQLIDQRPSYCGFVYLLSLLHHVTKYNLF